MNIAGYFSISPFDETILLPFYSIADRNQPFAAQVDQEGRIRKFVPIDLDQVCLADGNIRNIKWGSSIRVGSVQIVAVCHSGKIAVGLPRIVLKSLVDSGAIARLPKFAQVELCALVHGRDKCDQKMIEAIRQSFRPENSKTAVSIEKTWKKALASVDRDSARASSSKKFSDATLTTQERPDQFSIKRRQATAPPLRSVVHKSLYDGTNVDIDGVTYIECLFVNCRLHYRGGLFDVRNCTFENCAAILHVSTLEAKEFIDWAGSAYISLIESNIEG